MGSFKQASRRARSTGGKIVMSRSAAVLAALFSCWRWRSLCAGLDWTVVVSGGRLGFFFLAGAGFAFFAFFFTLRWGDFLAVFLTSFFGFFGFFFVAFAFFSMVSELR